MRGVRAKEGLPDVSAHFKGWAEDRAAAGLNSLDSADKTSDLLSRSIPLRPSDDSQPVTVLAEYHPRRACTR